MVSMETLKTMSTAVSTNLDDAVAAIGMSSERAHEFVLTIIDLMKSGPEYLDRYLAI
jgi:hypothetical protein